MKKIDRYYLSLILGAIPPVVGFFAGWWSTFSFFQTKMVFVFACSGLAVGLLLDILLLQKWVANAYQMDLKIWLLIYVFYSVCVFGFFMGVPVFNLFLAIPAGFLIGNKLAMQPSDTERKRRISLFTKIFTSVVLLMICVASAIFALRSPSTANDLEGMLILDFDVTPLMIYGIIIIGGAALLVSHWWLVSKMISLSYKWASKGKN